MHSALNIVSLISLILITIAASNTAGRPQKTGCARHRCHKIKCDPLESIREKCLTKKGILEEKGGWCQCCPVCIKRLYEDQNCSVSLNPQLPVRAKCTEGLHCDLKYRRCVRLINKDSDAAHTDEGNGGNDEQLSMAKNTTTKQSIEETTTILP